MTVSSLVSRANYVGSGVAVPYAYPFHILDATDLQVITREAATGLETELSYPGDYSVTGVGNRSGGSISLTQVLPAGDFVSIRRVRPMTQETDLRNLGTTPDTIENAFDHQIMVAQDLNDTLRRSARLADSLDPDSFDMTLPVPEPGTALVWNVNGSGLDNGALSDAQLSAWSASANQRLDVFSVGAEFTAGVTTALTLADDPGDIANVHILRRTGGANVPVLTDEYTVDAAGLVTFLSPIPIGTTRVEARYFRTYQVNVADARNVRVALPHGATVRVLSDLLDNSAELNVCNFGAVGNNATDCTTAFQTAIDAAEAAGGGKVIVPAGRWTLTNTVNMKSRVVLWGVYGGIVDGGTVIGGTVIEWAGPINTPVFKYLGTEFTDTHGLYVRCNSVAGATGFLLDSSNAPPSHNNYWQRCAVENCATGWQMGTSGATGYQSDAWEIKNFKVKRPSVAGIAVNSQNSGQNSVIEQGFIALYSSTASAIDLVESPNLVQIRSVSFACDPILAPTAVAIHQRYPSSSGTGPLMVQGCDFEMGATGYNIKVPNTSNTWDAMTLIGNSFAFGKIQIDGRRRVASIGNYMGSCVASMNCDVGWVWSLNDVWPDPATQWVVSGGARLAVADPFGTPSSSTRQLVAGYENLAIPANSGFLANLNTAGAFVAPGAGYIASYTAALTGPATGGNFTFGPVINGALAASATIATGGATHREEVVPPSFLPFDQFDVIDMRFSTPPGWTGTTLQSRMCFEVVYTPAP